MQEVGDVRGGDEKGALLALGGDVGEGAQRKEADLDIRRVRLRSEAQ